MGDKIVRFQVRVEEGGASWGVHMVANGIVCGLDVNTRNLKIVEGLALSGGLFPAVEKGTCQIPQDIDLSGWLDVETTAKGDSVSVSINGREIASVQDLKVRPLLGGSGMNTGSVAFGGPAGWSAVYRALAVTDLAGKELYTNELRDEEPTLSDFQVGTNHLSCTVDGAKRDRACFGGDLYVMGRSVAYSTAFFEAVKGSIQLLLSHQTSDGYIGNLCPIQAPEHDGPDEPPTYAFYSLTYGLLLVVAVKEYWLHSGDHAVVQKYLEKLKTFMAFVESMAREDGLVEAPPPLSSKRPNPHAPLPSHRATPRDSYPLKTAMPIDRKLPLGSNLPSTGSCLDVLAYANTLNLATDACATLNTRLNQHPNHAPPAFLDIPGWDASGVVSPYSTGFAVEALFAAGQARRALDLVRGVWGPMADPRGPNYSGAHWEAMRADGTPFNHDVSLVHGWSTWPVFLLPKYLAGLRPIEPGWSRFAVEPVFAGLELVECSLATPAGSIHVELRVNDVVGAADLTLRVPVGAEAVVKAPVGWVLQGKLMFRARNTRYTSR
ncbi:unnamed protein product [Parascedosporium putredinis]|uniref:Alpha-L-rhamnosidase n=1 Tax=Parascedosporium putredinis TaxID=1442378 RepID=A0A9P1MCD4_9PEZI|nr:unnamed protein product [Parascedosporium putredinis]CAI7996339.1 unnamed protein product [Parascedosporium putredinis]